jgi:serine protease Do
MFCGIETNNHRKLIRHMNKNLLTRNTVALLCGAVALAGLTTAAVGQSRATKAVPTQPEAEAEAGRVVPPARFSYSPIVKKVTPSVVKITTATKSRQVAMQGAPGMDNPLLRRFFGDQFEMPGQGQPMPMPRQQGLGSGVLISEDGYILTNNHVVDGADQVKVTLPDAREFEAKVVGRDPKTDLAVVKVEAKGLPHLELADTERTEVGDVVLAIGNPFGLSQSVTMGIVSATGRGNMGLDYEDFIQTDAPINPGNSGGALVDTEGRLVGINTMIFSRSGGNMGIGFAVPANLARSVMTSLISDGRVTRGYLGAMIQDVTPALAKEFKLKENSGALIGEVKSGSPASKAGLQAGDIVTEYNGKKVSDSRHFRLRVADTKPGSTVAMKVLRDGTPKSLNVTVRELPGEPALVKASTTKSDDGVLNDVAVGDLDAATRKQFDIPASVKGAVVTQVGPDGAAAEAGLKAGDVILEINRQTVKNADEAVKLTEDVKDKTTLLRVWSNGGSRYVVVDENDRKNG